VLALGDLAQARFAIHTTVLEENLGATIELTGAELIGEGQGDVAVGDTSAWAIREVPSASTKR
jgi:hypothetical protein